jgi:hypothetical protein
MASVGLSQVYPRTEGGTLSGENPGKNEQRGLGIGPALDSTDRPHIRVVFVHGLGINPSTI